MIRGKCHECGRRRLLYPDPREPPLDEDVCLCVDCAEVAYSDHITDLQDRLKMAVTEMAALRKSKVKVERSYTVWEHNGLWSSIEVKRER